MAGKNLSPEILRVLTNKVLPKEEARKLIAESQRGSKAATDRLVRHNMRMVFKVAVRYCFALPLEDLMQEGTLGLLKAIQDFDLTTNNCLSTYAQWWVSAFCKRAAQKCTGMVGINRANTRHIVQTHADTFTSLDDDAHGDADITNHEVVPNDLPPPDELLHKSQVSRMVNNLVASTAKDQRESMVAGRIADRKDKDFELGRLGARFGVSRERIRQIELRMKQKLTASRKLRKLANEA